MRSDSPAGAVPAWTLGWRMRRALAYADVAVEDIAEELGVVRGTISRWINDRGAPPRPIFLRHWALRTGVSYEWLVSGDNAAQVTQRNAPDSAAGNGINRA